MHALPIQIQRQKDTQADKQRGDGERQRGDEQFVLLLLLPLLLPSNPCVFGVCQVGHAATPRGSSSASKQARFGRICHHQSVLSAAASARRATWRGGRHREAPGRTLHYTAVPPSHTKMALHRHLALPAGTAPQCAITRAATSSCQPPRSRTGACKHASTHHTSRRTQSSTRAQARVLVFVAPQKVQLCLVSLPLPPRPSAPSFAFAAVPAARNQACQINPCFTGCLHHSPEEHACKKRAPTPLLLSGSGFAGQSLSA